MSGVPALGSTASVILTELCSDEPLDARLLRARAGGVEGGTRASVTRAVLAALAARTAEAQQSLRTARDAMGEGESAEIDLCEAWVAARAGDRSRALEARPAGTADAGPAGLAGIVWALALGDDDADARALCDRALGETDDARLGAYARVVAAELALGSGDVPAAHAYLDAIDGTEPRTGLLACVADLFRGEALLAGSDADPERARVSLSQAVWQLARIGAARELGLCYLAMARVEAASGRGADASAAWLARAEPLLARAGTPRDRERGRAAFRELGSRGPERVVAGDAAAKLFTSSLALARIDVPEELHEAVARLALELCAADAAELLELDDGGVLVTLSRHGHPLTSSRARLEQDVRDTLDAGVARLLDADGVVSSSGRAAIVPLLHDARLGWALVVARTVPSHAPLTGTDVEALVAYGDLVVLSIDRANEREAVRDALAHATDTLEALADGVLVLRGDGVVRALNEAAAWLIRTARDEVLGRRLGDVPGLAPLADALAPRRPLDAMTVCLDHVDLTVRSSVIAGGATVAVLEDLARAHERAQLLLDAHAPVGLDDLVGRDPAFRRAIDDARRAAASDAPLLMTGEPGTGKTVLAHAVHAASSRSAQPLVIADARGIPRERLESELFGWDAGAVPGARSTARPGLLERAGVGTLVVESIDAAPLDVQVRIADVLRRRVAARVGGRREIPIRARIVATAVRDLEAGASEAESSVHRELAARLCTVHVRIPPLRDRRSDVPALVEHFLGRHAERIGSRRVRITPGVLAQLEAHHWPGNVRELASTVELAASRLPTGIDVIDTVPAAIVRASGRGEIPTPLRPGALLPADHEPVLTLDEIERRVYRHALQQHGGNVAQAARALGVARGTFYNKLKRYGEKGD